eukprot:2430266-Rhodomonas_salina.1
MPARCFSPCFVVRCCAAVSVLCLGACLLCLSLSFSLSPLLSLPPSLPPFPPLTLTLSPDLQTLIIACVCRVCRGEESARQPDGNGLCHPQHARAGGSRLLNPARLLRGPQY